MPVLLLLIYVAAVADAAVGPRLNICGAAPDCFALLLLICLAVWPQPHSYLTAALIGLACDLLSPGRPGVGMACYAVVGYAACHWLERLSPHRPLARLVALFPVAFVLLVSLGTARWAMGDVLLPLQDVVRRAAMAGLYTAGTATALVFAFQGAPRLAARAKQYG